MPWDWKVETATVASDAESEMVGTWTAEADVVGDWPAESYTTERVRWNHSTDLASLRKKADAARDAYRARLRKNYRLSQKVTEWMNG